LSCQKRFETAAAARFIHSARANDNQFFRSHQPLRMHGRIAAAHTNSEQLGDFFRYGEQTGHGLERTPHKIRVETCNDHSFAEIGEFHATFNNALAEELGLVNPDHFGTWCDPGQNLFASFHQFRIKFQAGVADDSVLRVALIDHWLENLNALFGNLSAAQAPYQLLTFAGEHWPDYNFDPTHVPFYNVHAVVS
jgi:hypothetical protein